MPYPSSNIELGSGTSVNASPVNPIEFVALTPVMPTSVTSPEVVLRIKSEPVERDGPSA